MQDLFVYSENIVVKTLAIPVALRSNVVCWKTRCVRRRRRPFKLRLLLLLFRAARRTIFVSFSPRALTFGIAIRL